MRRDSVPRVQSARLPGARNPSLPPAYPPARPGAHLFHVNIAVAFSPSQRCQKPNSVRPARWATSTQCRRWSSAARLSTARMIAYGLVPLPSGHAPSVSRFFCFSRSLSLSALSFFPSFSPLFRRMAMTHCDTSYAKTHAPEQKNWSLSPLLSLSLSLSLSFFLVPPVLMSCCYHDPG